jgi:predicted P-loop ATPase
MAEMLAVLNTKYNEATKAFLSRQYDSYRKPYGTRAEDIARQCVFAGTSNIVNFLPLDRSGNRRFLPIMCDASKAETHILEDETASREYILQMWAALHPRIPSPGIIRIMKNTLIPNWRIRTFWK